MKTYYFNTGVKPYVNSNLYKDQIWLNGTKQIPFDCKNVPENAVFMFACNDSNLPESKLSNIIVREIFNSSLCSKFAYFRLNS